MYNEIVRVEKIENGYQVSCYEPSPVKKGGKKGIGMSDVPYAEPWKTYYAKDIAAVCGLIEEKLPAIKRGNESEEYGSAFSEAGESEEGYE